MMNVKAANKERYSLSAQSDRSWLFTSWLSSVRVVSREQQTIKINTNQQFYSWIAT